MTVAVAVRLDGELGVNRRIHHRHGHRCHADGLAVASAGEDHVFHPGAAEALGGLFAENPADRVAQVRFAATVGTDYSRDARAVKAHFRAVAKGLKPLQFNTLQFEQWVLPFPVNKLFRAGVGGRPASRGMQPILNRKTDDVKQDNYEVLSLSRIDHNMLWSIRFTKSEE